ncbi:MAG: hypothetical protein WC071_12560 [Victivallaceae bacterium]
MKIFKLVVLALLPLALLCGCSSTSKSNGNETYELTQQEQSDLIALARHIITRNDKFASQAQKSIILTTPPEVKSYLPSPGFGKVSMTWELGSKAIRAVASERLLTSDMNWRISVIKKGEVKTGKDAISKAGDLTKEDFEELKKL